MSPPPTELLRQVCEYAAKNEFAITLHLKAKLPSQFNCMLPRLMTSSSVMSWKNKGTSMTLQRLQKKGNMSHQGWKACACTYSVP